MIKSGFLGARRYLENLAPELYVFLVFIVTDGIFFFGLMGSSSWLTLFFLSGIALVLNSKLKNLIASFLLTAIYSFPFHLPGKYYANLIFKSYQLTPGREDYFLSYGVGLKNVLLFIVLLLVFHSLITRKWTFEVKEFRLVVITCLSGLGFFLVALYTGFTTSYFPNLSTVWLFHYISVFYVGLLVFIVGNRVHSIYNYVRWVLLASIFLQSAISFSQFVRQSWAGLPIESATYSSAYYPAADVIQSLFRVVGTLGQTNQLALVILIMLVIIFSQVMTKNKMPFVVGGLFGLITIFLTQSRSSWLALLGSMCIAIALYGRDLVKQFSKINPRRLIIGLGLFATISTLLVISRLILSLNAFSEDGGVPLRLEMIREAIFAISLRPWLGYGLGMNEVVLYEMFPNGYNYVFPAPVHLGALQFMLESGLIGTTLFILPFGYCLAVFLSKVRERKAYIHKVRKSMGFFEGLAGSVAFIIFYFFQPHEGVREFYYLGIILAYCLLAVYRIKLLEDENIKQN